MRVGCFSVEWVAWRVVCLVLGHLAYSVVDVVNGQVIPWGRMGLLVVTTAGQCHACICDVFRQRQYAD